VSDQPQPPQVYRLEVRWDHRGTEDEARAEAQRVAALVDGEVTAVFDEAWEEI
jgi:hypothetical protein